MLKKTAIIVMTSGLLLVPIGASAHESAIPDCVGVDCASLPHTHADKDRVNMAGGTMKKMYSSKSKFKKDDSASYSPFPRDNARD